MDEHERIKWTRVANQWLGRRALGMIGADEQLLVAEQLGVSGKDLEAADPIRLGVVVAAFAQSTRNPFSSERLGPRIFGPRSRR